MAGPGAALGLGYGALLNKARAYESYHEPKNFYDIVDDIAATNRNAKSDVDLSFMKEKPKYKKTYFDEMFEKAEQAEPRISDLGKQASGFNIRKGAKAPMHGAELRKFLMKYGLRGGAIGALLGGGLGFMEGDDE